MNWLSVAASTTTSPTRFANTSKKKLRNSSQTAFPEKKPPPPPVAIVNQTLANRLWPGENPLGKRFSFISSSGPYISVVGVARDGQYFFLSPDPQPYFYLPLSQNFTSFRSLQVRSSLPVESVGNTVNE